MDSFAIINAMKYWAKVINSNENEYNIQISYTSKCYMALKYPNKQKLSKSSKGFFN